MESNDEEEDNRQENRSNKLISEKVHMKRARILAVWVQSKLIFNGIYSFALINYQGRIWNCAYIRCPIRIQSFRFNFPNRRWCGWNIVFGIYITIHKSSNKQILYSFLLNLFPKFFLQILVLIGLLRHRDILGPHTSLLFWRSVCDLGLGLRFIATPGFNLLLCNAVNCTRSTASKRFYFARLRSVTSSLIF